LPANQSFCVGIESAYLPHRSADQINQIPLATLAAWASKKGQTLIVCGLADVRVDVYACHWRLRVHSTETSRPTENVKNVSQSARRLGSMETK